MSWSDVKVGDWVRVSQKTADTEISGTVTDIGPGWVEIGRVNLPPAPWEVQEVRKTYKVGDIGFLKGCVSNYVGIYSQDGCFYSDGVRMFRDTDAGVKILGNVNDL